MCICIDVRSVIATFVDTSTLQIFASLSRLDREYAVSIRIARIREKGRSELQQLLDSQSFVAQMRNASHLTPQMKLGCGWHGIDGTTLTCAQFLRNRYSEWLAYDERFPTNNAVAAVTYIAQLKQRLQVDKCGFRSCQSVHTNDQCYQFSNPDNCGDFRQVVDARRTPFYQCRACHDGFVDELAEFDCSVCGLWLLPSACKWRTTIARNRVPLCEQCLDYSFYVDDSDLSSGSDLNDSSDYDDDDDDYEF